MGYRKHEFGLNEGYIEAVFCRFWSYLPIYFLEKAWKYALFWFRSRSAEMTKDYFKYYLVETHALKVKYFY